MEVLEKEGYEVCIFDYLRFEYGEWRGAGYLEGFYLGFCFFRYDFTFGFRVYLVYELVKAGVFSLSYVVL